jgi:hypothetical protein
MGASINLCITKKSKLHYDKEGENQKGALFFIPKHKKKKNSTDWPEIIGAVRHFIGTEMLR